MTARLLIVDDEADLRAVYAEILQLAGFEVETAADGIEATHRFTAFGPFDAVFTDINMPGLDGVKLLRWVRERDLDVPVVIMTGNPRLETAVEALAQGALRYLLKPVSEADLVETAASAARLSALARLKREALTLLGAHDKLLGDRAGLEVVFARALTELWMAYQPIVAAVDGRIVAHEALLRSDEPTLPHPGALLDAAERLGRVQDLGRGIRRSVAHRLSRDDVAGDTFVNLHPLELTDETLFARDSPLADRARSVVLEVTERASLEHVPDLRQRVAVLRSLGYRIAIDDLGAGYAGLTALSSLEPEVVKLDMALVRNVDREPIKRRLIGSMVRLSKELGATVVAEGVETSDERAALVDLGCDLLQGYLFGRPQRAD